MTKIGSKAGQTLTGIATDLLKAKLEPKEQAIRGLVNRTHDTLSSLASTGLKTATNGIRQQRQSFAAQFSALNARPAAQFSALNARPAALPAPARFETQSGTPSTSLTDKLGRVLNSPLMGVAAGLFAPLSFKLSLALTTAHHVHQALQQHQAQAAGQGQPAGQAQASGPAHAPGQAQAPEEPINFDHYMPPQYDEGDAANFYASLQDLIGSIFSKAQRMAQGMFPSAEAGPAAGASAPAQAASPPSPEMRKAAAEKLGVPENSDWKTLFDMKSMPQKKSELLTQIEGMAKARSHAYSVQAQKENHPPELANAVQSQINAAREEALKFANQFGNEKEYSRHNLVQALGVAPDASDSDMKKAYFKFAIQQHPDKVPEDKRAAAKEKFQAVGDCWTAYQKA
jgi:hypothetical protein